jgi:hypothetical protein
VNKYSGYCVANEKDELEMGILSFGQWALIILVAFLVIYFCFLKRDKPEPRGEKVNWYNGDADKIASYGSTEHSVV